MHAVNKMTISDLRKMCRDLHISGYENVRREDLVSLITTHQIKDHIKKGLDTLLKIE